MLEKSVRPDDKEYKVELELDNVLTPGSLRLPVEPPMLAFVAPTLTASMVLTMVGFPSNPSGAPNNGDTLEVPAI